MDEKIRTLVHHAPRSWTTGYQYYWTTKPITDFTSGETSPVLSKQTTASRGHAWPSAGRGTTDLGGNFTTMKIDRFVPSDNSSYKSQNRGHSYEGPEMAFGPQSAIDYALSLVTPSSDITLMQMGSKAIAKTIPTNPVADAGTFIGELRAGLPSAIGKELFKTKFKDYRKAGGEYLNVEFGWKPLISDLQKFGKAAIESNDIVEQLHRDSGKNIRRKYTFPEEIAYNTVRNTGRVSDCCSLSLYPYLYRSVGGGSLDITTKVVTKTWFSGCYTYHLNLGNTLRDRMERHAAEARKLFGVELTPATVWNLAPWSWAVDWQGNVGDVLHNVGRFSQDGLVMRYGYIMQQKTAEVTYALSPQGRLSTSPYSDLRLTVSATSKVRRRATPFGFGFDMTALNGRQSAILGALGISRGPRHL